MPDKIEKNIVLIVGDATPVGFMTDWHCTQFEVIAGCDVRTHLADPDKTVWFLPNLEFETDGDFLGLLRAFDWSVTPKPMTREKFARLTEPVTVLVQSFDAETHPDDWYWEVLTATPATAADRQDAVAEPV
jgi:hypothetical protein